MKRKNLMIIASIALLLSACGQIGTSVQSNTQTIDSENVQATVGQSDTQTETIEESQLSEESTIELQSASTTVGDEDTDTSSEGATELILADSATASVNGVTVSEQVVTITQAGTYLVSGSLSEGQLIINVPKEEKVHLILDGVTIVNSNGPAILVEQTEKIVVTLASDSVNTLTDGQDYYIGDDTTELGAAFFSREDLVFNGEGALVIEGNNNNGIHSKDSLTIVSGEYTVNALNNGLKGKDEVIIIGGIFNLTTMSGDGIQASNADDATLGYIMIDDGSFVIHSSRDGIQAESSLTINGGEFDITTGEESLSTEESYKGLKSSGNLLINAGSINIDSQDDGIHANADISITGGEIIIASGDDGIHADNILTIDGGTIQITQSYEGIEATGIVINGGDIQVTASDDGLNAGGGSDEETATGVFGADTFMGGPGGGMDVDESKYIELNGGTLYINAEGDGIDSNGSVVMHDGLVLVDGPTNGGNGAVDYGSSFTQNGGTLIAAGASGMAVNVTEGGGQAALGIYFDTTQEAGTIISLEDSNGNAIVTYQAAKTFDHILISSPELIEGQTYSLISGTQVSGEAIYGYYEGANVVNGLQLGALTISGLVTNLTQSGEVTQGSMMGGMPGGGGFDQEQGAGPGMGQMDEETMRPPSN